MERYFKGPHGITNHAYIFPLVWIIRGLENYYARGMTKLDSANAAAVVIIGRHRV